VFQRAANIGRHVFWLGRLLTGVTRGRSPLDRGLGVSPSFVFNPLPGKEGGWGMVRLVIRQSLLWALLTMVALIVVACAPGSAVPAARQSDVSVPPQVAPIRSGPSPAPGLVATPVAASSFPLAIRDSLGREIIISARPDRIISLSPAHSEIFYGLGAGDSIVGRDTFSDYPAEIKAKPEVGYSKLDMEKIASLQPDLIYAATRQKPFIPDLEKLGLKVLYLEEPQSVEGVFEHMRTLGRLTGRITESERMVASSQERIKVLQQELTKVEKGPRIFYEVTSSLYTASGKSFIGDMLRALKTQNIAEALDRPFPQLSQEALIQQDPQVIILGDAATYGLGKESPETVKARPGWQAVSAVKNSRIYEVDSSLVSRPGPRIVDGLEFLAKAIYPELFP